MIVELHGIVAEISLAAVDAVACVANSLVDFSACLRAAADNRFSRRAGTGHDSLTANSGNTYCPRQLFAAYYGICSCLFVY